MHLYQCASASRGERPTQVGLTAGKQGEAAVCLPREWFASDGSTFSAAGQAEFSDLLDVLTKDSTKHIKIVGLHPEDFKPDDKTWTWAAGALVVSTLRTPADTDSIEIFSARASMHQLAEWSHSGKDSLQAVDLSKAAQSVETLVLVLPEKKN